MSKNEIVTRMYNFDIRAKKDEEHGNYITGRPIVYNSKTDLGCFEEIIVPGALDKANLKDVRFLVNHDTKMIPLARSRNNNKNSTMQLQVGKEGMDTRMNLDTERNTVAMNLYSAIERGDISGMSFMFSINDEEWEGLDTDHPIRHIKEIGQVFEVSAVTFPAYEATDISARDKEALDSARAILDSVRRSQSLDSDKDDLELLKAKNRNLLI